MSATIESIALENLDIDFAQAQRFLTLLDEDAEIHVFQTFDDNNDRKAGSLAKVLIGTFDQHRKELATLNRKGAGIFVTVNATDGKGRRSSNVSAVRAVWIEADRPDCPPAPVVPHIEVESSPGKYHRYFLCDPIGEPALSEHRAVQRRLVDDFGSDPNAMDLPRVLRLPGFFHLKGEPHRVDMVGESGEAPWTWNRIKEVFPPKEERKHEPVDAEPLTSTKHLEVLAALEHIDPDVEFGEWLKVGMGIHHAAPGEDGFAIWDGWSRRGSMYKEGECRYRWGTFSAQGNATGQTTISSVYAMARTGGWDGKVSIALVIVALGEVEVLAKSDPGWAYEADRIGLFLRLSVEAPPQWQRIRERLRSAGVRLRDLDRLIKFEAQKRAHERMADAAQEDHPYCERNGSTYWTRQTMVGPEDVRLANFAARIVGEVIRDDGACMQSVFVIEGRNGKGGLGEVEVSTDGFGSMGWAAGAFGNRAIVNAGSALKDHFRAAVQYLSGDVPRRVVYEHTGWRLIDGQWLYLSGTGAIGADGHRPDIETEFEDGMARYSLPEPLGERVGETVRVILRFLKVSKDEIIGYLLLAIVFRAPLREVYRIDFSVFFAGLTGGGKTTVAALAQAFWGPDFDDRHLPASWQDTATDLEIKLHRGKDAVVVIDDLKTKAGNVGETKRQEAKADRVLHSAGNLAGRGRRSADLKARPVYHNQAMALSTGEYVPSGASLRARMVIREFKPSGRNLDVITGLQGLAADGTLSRIMSAYAQWLAPRIDTLKEEFPKRIKNWRNQEFELGHARYKDTLGNLVEALRTGFDFCLDVGAIDESERDLLLEKGDALMIELMADQRRYLDDADEIRRFLRLLSSAVDMCRAHVCDKATGGAPVDKPHLFGWRKNAESIWEPLGERIGWIDIPDGAQYLHLHPDAAFAAVHALSRDQGDPLTTPQRTLFADLKTSGMSVMCDKGKTSTQRSVGGAPKRVTLIPAKLVFGSY